MTHTWMSKPLAALMTAGALLTAGTAQAVSISFQQSFALSASSDTSGGNTPDSVTLSLPSFNVALGNLIGVTVMLNSLHTLGTAVNGAGLGTITTTAVSNSTAEINGLGFSYSAIDNLNGSASCTDGPNYAPDPGGTDPVAQPVSCAGFELEEQNFADTTDLLVLNSADLFKSTNGPNVDLELLLSNGVELDSCDTDEGSPQCSGTAQSAWYDDIVDGILKITYEYEARPPTNTPEPATLALVGLALVGVGYARRRRLD